MPKFIIRRKLNEHGEMDFLQKFHPLPRTAARPELSWTTICSSNKETAQTHNYRDSAESARVLAERYVPTLTDGRPIEWSVVEV